MSEFSKDAYILIGPPGSGKSSVTREIAAGFSAPVISGRNIVPHLVPEYESKREIIPDYVFLPELRKILVNIGEGANTRIVFDNIPRTEKQARELVCWAESYRFTLHTMHLMLSKEDVLDRTLNREVCPSCQRSYHPIANPSLEQGFCNYDGYSLVRRSGDRKENIPGAYSRYLQMAEEIIPVLRQGGAVYEVKAPNSVMEAVDLTKKYFINERQLALADIDGTLYEGFMLLPFAISQKEEGFLEQTALDKIISDVKKYKDREWDYETFAENVLINWAQGLRGFSYSKVLNQARCFLQDKGNAFYQETKELIALLNKTHDVFFVTGEPQFLGKASVDLLGVEGCISSEFEVKEDTFTGNITRSLAKREEKQRAIAHLIKKYPFRGSIALGDSPGDIEMLESTEYAICVGQNDFLVEHARLKNWKIAQPEQFISVVKSIFL